MELGESAVPAGATISKPSMRVGSVTPSAESAGLEGASIRARLAASITNAPPAHPKYPYADTPLGTTTDSG